MNQAPPAPRSNYPKAPEPLEFLSGYSAPRKKGLVYNLSMTGSVLLHGLLLLGLWMNPELIFINWNWSLAPAPRQAKASDGQYEVVTYVPISSRPLYLPRRPVGNLYSSHDSLAISRPPEDRRVGNQQPYSQGTTKEPLITGVVRDLEVKKEPAKETTQDRAEVDQQIPDTDIREGVAPVLQVPPTDRDPSPGALLLPPKPLKEEKEEVVGLPKSKDIGPLEESQPPKAQPDERSRSRIADEVAKRLKMADVGQRIFDNEASALRSEGSGFFDTKGFELSSYSDYIVERIKEHWLIPGYASRDKGRSTIIFYIEKDGQISGLRIVTASGLAPLDRAALNSVLGASPFPPLPHDFTGNHIGAKLVFSYNEVRQVRNE